jgi:hypothetical protein
MKKKTTFFTSSLHSVVITSPIHCRKRFFSLSLSHSHSLQQLFILHSIVLLVLLLCLRRDFWLFLGFSGNSKKKQRERYIKRNKNSVTKVIEGKRRREGGGLINIFLIFRFHFIVMRLPVAPCVSHSLAYYSKKSLKCV